MRRCLAFFGVWCVFLTELTRAKTIIEAAPAASKSSSSSSSGGSSERSFKSEFFRLQSEYGMRRFGSYEEREKGHRVSARKGREANVNVAGSGQKEMKIGPSKTQPWPQLV